MAQRPTLILASGGIRSLVATALLLSSTDRPRVVLLHVRDGRPNATARLDHVRRQAQHFHLNQIIELEIPHLLPKAFGDALPQPAAPLVRPQMLTIALAQAMTLEAERIIWPAQVNADYTTVARLTEQIVLLQHLAHLEQPELPTIETPLLELSDQQMVELGASLEVPWQLAWTCSVQGDAACRTCGSCRRRRTAFHAAGMTDPTDHAAPAPALAAARR